MPTVNQRLEELTAQVAELAEQVRNLAAARYCEDTAFAAGVAFGETRRTGSSLPAGRSDRRGHLSLISGGAR